MEAWAKKLKRRENLLEKRAILNIGKDDWGDKPNVWPVGADMFCKHCLKKYSRKNWARHTRSQLHAKNGGKAYASFARKKFSDDPFTNKKDEEASRFVQRKLKKHLEAIKKPNQVVGRPPLLNEKSIEKWNQDMEDEVEKAWNDRLPIKINLEAQKWVEDEFIRLNKKPKPKNSQWRIF